MRELHRGEPCEVGMSSSRLVQLRQRAAEWVDTGLTQSLCYVVARRGVIVAEGAFGRETFAPASPPVTLGSVFSLASATKPITATAVMRLVDEGALSLTRPVIEYLPELAGRGSHQILVHHLLTHTSGYSMESASRHLREGGDPYTLDPDGPPGVEHRYCGMINYLFLSEIVRRVSGSPLAEYASKHIFAPLGMRDTSIGLTAELAPRRVVPNPNIYTGIADYDPNDPVELATPDGSSGGVSTAMDMAILVQMFLNGGCYNDKVILSRASVRAMTKNQIPGASTRDIHGQRVDASWGFGWEVQSSTLWQRNGCLAPEGTFYHEGASGAAIFAEPASQTLGILLSVIRRMDPVTEEFFWEFDRFQNLVMAAIVE